MLIILPKHTISSLEIWPDYPKAVIEEGCIYILFDDDSVICWGSEDADKLAEVATDIEEGLRAIRYLTDKIRLSIKESWNVLEDRGFSDSQIREYLKDSLVNIIGRETDMGKVSFPIYDDVKKPFYIQ